MEHGGAALCSSLWIPPLWRWEYFFPLQKDSGDILPLHKAVHFLMGVFLDRLEFTKNLLGWAGALLNCCTLCSRLVELILATCPGTYKWTSINQTDPKQRITVRQLLTHPWMMEGYETPVKWQTRSLNWIHHPTTSLLILTLTTQVPHGSAWRAGGRRDGNPLWGFKTDSGD